MCPFNIDPSFVEYYLKSYLIPWSNIIWFNPNINSDFQEQLVKLFHIHEEYYNLVLRKLYLPGLQMFENVIWLLNNISSVLDRIQHVRADASILSKHRAALRKDRNRNIHPVVRHTVDHQWQRIICRGIYLFTLPIFLPTSGLSFHHAF